MEFGRGAVVSGGGGGWGGAEWSDDTAFPMYLSQCVEEGGIREGGGGGRRGSAVVSWGRMGGNDTPISCVLKF